METVLQVGLSNAGAAAGLGLGVLLLAWVCRRPALLHGLWLLVLVKLITPPLVSLEIGASREHQSRTDFQSVPQAPVADVPALPAKEELQELMEAIEAGVDANPEPIPLAEAPVDPIQEEIAAPPPMPQKPARSWPWQPLVLGIWLAGTVGWYGLALVRIARFGRVLRHAHPAPPELVERARRLAGQLGLRRLPSLWLVPGPIAPLVWALGRPRLVLPAQLFERITQEQQDTLLLHELAHLLRGDHLVRLLEFVVRGLYWWHPVVWYACRELREKEEQCCDAWVVSTLPGSGRTYATALLETLDFLSEVRAAVPVLASGIGHVADLKRRLQMIMRQTTPRSLTWGGLLGLLVLGGLVLPLGPTWGQDKPKPKEPTAGAGREKPEKARAEELEKAQIELKKLQDELARKQEEVHQMQKHLAEAAEKLKIEAARVGEKAETEARVRIWAQRVNEETAKRQAEKARSAEEMAGKMKDAKKRIQVQIWMGDGPREITIAEVDGKWIIVNPPDMGGRPMFPPGGPRALTPKVPGQPHAPVPPPAPPKPAGPDHRIENLEKRLENLERAIDRLMEKLDRPGMTPRPGARPGSAYDTPGSRGVPAPAVNPFAPNSAPVPAAP